MTKQYYIPQAPIDIYENVTHTRMDTQMSEAQKSMKVLSIEYGGRAGINVFVDGAHYPKKGFPTPEAMWSANQAKRLLVEMSKLFTHPLFWIPTILLYEKVLGVYNEIAIKAVKPFILKEEFLTPIAYELRKIITPFNKEFADIFSMMIDIDNAYRYRLEDLFTESSKEKMLANPRKEIKRLMKLSGERDQYGVSMKVQRMAKIILLLLWVPSVKKKIIKAIEECNFANLQMDQADYYWMLMRQDYNMGGMSYEERQVILKNYKIPMEYNINE